MRQVASFLLFGLALGANAAEIWRWTDANGVVHLSDQPVPGAERIKSASPPSTPVAPAPPIESVSRAAAAQPAVPYTCSIVTPVVDDVFPAAAPVPAALRVEPSLTESFRVQVFLNGTPAADWPGTALSHSFAPLYRGSYTLGARILDAAGRPLCTAPSITFHVRQPSVLSPARRPPPRR